MALSSLRLPVFAVLVAAATAAFARDGVVPDGAVAVAADSARRMTVPVLVNGQGPYPFVVDTGADRTVISRELAVRLGLPAGPAALLHDTVGIGRVETARVASLRFGDREVRDVRAAILAEGNLGAAGMLGVDSLHDCRVLIDFAHGRIVIQPSEVEPDPDPGAITVRARRRYGQLILVDAEAHGASINVILDSGAQSSIGNTALRRLLARKDYLPAGVPTTIISVTGRTAPAVFVPVDEVKLGGVTVRNLPIAFADVHTFRQFGLARKPAMLLGIDILRRFDQVSVDFARKKVRLSLPRAKVSHGRAVVPQD